MCTRVCTHAHTYAYTRTDMSACTHTHTHTHTHKRTHTRTHTHTRAHAHTTTTQHHTAGPENGLIHTKTERKEKMKTTPSNQNIYAYLFSLSAVLIRTIQRLVVHSVVTNDGTLSSSIIVGPALTFRSHRENSKTKTATVFTSRRGIKWQSRTCWPVLPGIQPCRAALQHNGCHDHWALSKTARIEIEHRPGHVGNDPTLQKPPHIHRHEEAMAGA